MSDAREKALEKLLSQCSGPIREAAIVGFECGEAFATVRGDAQRDRYRKALEEIAEGGRSGDKCCDIADEALEDS